MEGRHKFVFGGTNVGGSLNVSIFLKLCMCISASWMLINEGAGYKKDDLSGEFEETFFLRLQHE